MSEEKREYAYSPDEFAADLVKPEGERSPHYAGLYSASKKELSNENLDFLEAIRKVEKFEGEEFFAEYKKMHEVFFDVVNLNSKNKDAMLKVYNGIDNRGNNKEEIMQVLKYAEPNNPFKEIKNLVTFDVLVRYNTSPEAQEILAQQAKAAKFKAPEFQKPLQEFQQNLQKFQSNVKEEFKHFKEEFKHFKEEFKHIKEEFVKKFQHKKSEKDIDENQPKGPQP